VARPRTHSEDDVLDAARAIVLRDGARSATVAAIARASGAPSGSLYHAFGSRDGVLVAAWTRAARRSQAGWLEAARIADPVAAGVAMALSLLAFAREQPEECRFLLGTRLEDLVDGDVPVDYGEVNAPIVATVAAVARRLGGPAARQRVVLATVDLPYGAIRRRLLGGKPPPRALDGPLAAAARAALTHVPEAPS
jgi:AcrR family transcriptional regulator